MEYADWEQRLPIELKRWENKITNLDNDDVDMDFRLDFTSEIQGFIKAYISPGNKILDVGAGMVSSLGLNVNGHELDITAIDILADEYNQLLDKHNLISPIETIKGTFETIVDQFGENVFDFVHSRDSLDYCNRPIHALWNMIRACKTGGYIFIQVFENEATRTNYKGLCQWDFCIMNGKLLMNGMNVLETVACPTVQLKKETENGRNLITWVMKKG